MDVCDQKGKDCIEGSSTKNYNCSTTCVGIYADVQQEDMNSEEGAADSEKYEMLVAEYMKFKEKNVKHFKFNLSANSNASGEFEYPCFNVKFVIYSKQKAIPLNAPIGGDLL